MNRIIKIGTFFCLFGIFGNEKIQAQEKTDINLGVRLGWTSGIILKAPAGGGRVSALFGSRPYSTSMTLLYEQTTGIKSGLGIYYGLGGHISGYQPRNYYYPGFEKPKYYYYGSSGWGLDLLLGLEIPVKKTPVSLGFEIKPFVEFYGDGNRYIAPDPAINMLFRF